MEGVRNFLARATSLIMPSSSADDKSNETKTAEQRMTQSVATITVKQTPVAEPLLFNENSSTENVTEDEATKDKSHECEK